MAELLGKRKSEEIDTLVIRIRREVLEKIITGSAMGGAGVAGGGGDVPKNQSTPPPWPRGLLDVPKSLAVGMSAVSSNYWAVLLAGLAEVPPPPSTP